MEIEPPLVTEAKELGRKMFMLDQKRIRAVGEVELWTKMIEKIDLALAILEQQAKAMTAKP